MRRRLAVGGGLAVAALVALWLATRQSSAGESAATAPDQQEAVTRRKPAKPRARPAPAPVAPVPAPEVGQADTMVRCTVGDALSGWPLRLFMVEDGSPLEWRVESGTLVFEPPAPSGEAGLTWGYLLRREDAADSFARVTWSGTGTDDATCAISRLPAALDAAVFGRVRGAERLPEGTVFLEGCGLQERRDPAPIDVDGGFFLQTQEGRCSLRAWRQEGLLRLPGPWVEVDALAGTDREVDLEVPTFAPAGMGNGFEPVDGGVLVNRVHDGTPAAAAGLTSGDIITSIDGVGTDGMDVEEFLLHGIGPSGSDVQLVGQGADGEPFDVIVRRAPIN